MFLEECKNSDYEENSDEKTLEKVQKEKNSDEKLYSRKIFFSSYIKDGKEILSKTRRKTPKGST